MGNVVQIPLAPAGGVADSLAGGRLPSGFAGELLNMFHRRGVWVRRRSAQALHAQAYAVRLAGVAALKNVALAAGTTDYTLICGVAGSATASPGFAVQSGALLLPLPFNGFSASVPIPVYEAESFWRAWRFAAPDNNRLFAARRMGVGKVPYHVGKTQVTPLGISAPTAAPTVAAVAGGSLPAGTWGACCYTFTTDDGAESSRSATASVTTALNDLRRWTLQISTHPRVTGRRLYIPVASGAIPYYAVDVPNNTALTFDESTLDAALARHIGPTRNGLPPSWPEDIEIAFERTWIVSNYPSPGWWYSDIDDIGPQFEAFSTSRVLRIPPRGGRRAIAVRSWDEKRLLLVTDASMHVARQNGAGFEVEDLSTSYGAASPHCVAVGVGGVVLCYDGRVVVRTEGGPPRVVSTGFVDRVLSKVPAAYAERSVMAYVPEEGLFYLAVPSTSSSTDPDLVLAYDPATEEWHKAGFLWTGSAHRAPVAFGLIPAGATTRTGITGEWITAACFAHDNRAFWLASPSLRDEGPTNVHVVMLSSPVPPQPNGRQLGVARTSWGAAKRLDAPSESVLSEAAFSARLLLGGNRYTAAVSASRAGRDQYVHARTQNLDDLDAVVQLELSADVDHLLEVFDIQAEVVPFGRVGRWT